MTYKNIIVGVDLHGTLLGENERIIDGTKDKLISLFENKPKNIKFYICTGNDLPFVKRKIGSLLDSFDGAILETGAVVSTDNLNEKILVNDEILSKIRKIEKDLIEMNIPEVYKYARRLATVSIFPKFGFEIPEFYEKIKSLIPKNDLFRITYSSVAVDIIPVGFDKFSGLNYFADNDDFTAGFADSKNDIELLRAVDLAYLPRNSHEDVIAEIAKLKIRTKNLEKNSYIVSEKRETFAVIEGMEFLINSNI